MNDNYAQSTPYMNAYRAIKYTFKYSIQSHGLNLLPSNYTAFCLISLFSKALGIPPDTVAQKLDEYDEFNREQEDDRRSEEAHKYNMSLTIEDAYEDGIPPDRD